MPEIPQRLTGALSGRYFLERELGQGWNATVYVAEDIRRGEQVAMKVVRPDLSLVLDAAPFVDTMRTVMVLEHPGVLRVLDAGASEGVLFYVAPLVSAESLRDRLTREERLDPDAAVAITRDVAAAVDDAHRRGLIHGALKPENVLLAARGTMVADFGFDAALRRAGRGRVSARDFQPRRPHYLSPERARFGDGDAPSDLYAIGCLLYEMLAAVPPFDGSSAEEILERILTLDPEPLARRRPELPGRLAQAVHRALAKRPADRYPTVLEFAAAL